LTVKEGGRYYDEIHVFRSFRTSGHQTKMDVIGNNVANVNTVGLNQAGDVPGSFQPDFKRSQLS